MTNPKLEGLTPQNSQLIFIDHQCVVTDSTSRRDLLSFFAA